MRFIHRFFASIIFTSILLLSSCSTSSVSTNKLEATVMKIVDGDTITVQLNGKKETIRMLLIDTPETHHPHKPVQPFGQEASQYAEQILSNSKVTLEIGTTKRDKYGRMLAYVYKDGKMYNELIVKEGLARVAYVFPPNDKYVDTLKETEATAKEQNLGIWSIPNYVKENGFDTSVVKDEYKQPSTSDTSEGNLPYAPDGPDRDCSDFTAQKDAQLFFKLAGGPEQDPHRLDRDGDGKVCETLP